MPKNVILIEIDDFVIGLCQSAIEILMTSRLNNDLYREFIVHIAVICQR